MQDALMHVRVSRLIGVYTHQPWHTFNFLAAWLWQFKIPGHAITPSWLHAYYGHGVMSREGTLRCQCI